MPLSDEHIKTISLEDTAFVIGSGPSLNKVDMTLLEGLNTISMNRQYVSYKSWGFFPKYYTIIDQMLIKAIYEKEIIPQLLNNPECTIEKYFIVGGGELKDSKKHYQKIIQIPEYSECLSQDVLKKNDFGSESDKRNLGNIFMANGHGYSNCGIFALSLSYALGYKRAVLIGIDAQYKFGEEKSIEDDYSKNWYHPDYYPIDDNTYSEIFDREYQNLDISKHGDFTFSHAASTDGPALWDFHKNHLGGFCNRSNFEIISCTPNSIINNDHGCDKCGRYGGYDYVDLEKLLNLYKEEII